MSSIQLDQSAYAAGQLTLILLASSAKLTLIEALPAPDEPGIPETALRPIAAAGPGADLLHELSELESLNLIERNGESLRRAPAAADLILVRNALLKWGWSSQPSIPETAENPAIPGLARLVGKIWATDILVYLAIRPSSPKQLRQSLPGYSLSTIKRYLQGSQQVGLLGKGLDGNRRSQYSPARFGLLLIRPLCCALRLEQRHLGDFVQPPSTAMLRAGMSVIARLIQLKDGGDRDILFEIVDDNGNPVVVKHAVYRDGVLVNIGPDVHDDTMLCLRGTAEAWYDVIIDGELGGMLAINRGAKTLLRQIPREFRR